MCFFASVNAPQPMVCRFTQDSTTQTEQTHRSGWIPLWGSLRLRMAPGMAKWGRPPSFRLHAYQGACAIDASADTVHTISNSPWVWQSHGHLPQYCHCLRPVPYAMKRSRHQTIMILSKNDDGHARASGAESRILQPGTSEVSII